MAADYDGHPENAAASVYGGLVAATTVEGVPVYARLPLSDDLAFVAIVPDRNLSTPGAQAVLPETLSRVRRVQPGADGPAPGRPGRPDRAHVGGHR